MNNTTCPHCGQEKKAKGFRLHVSSCQRFHSNKDLIFSLYDSGWSIIKIHKNFNLSTKFLSDCFRLYDKKILISRNSLDHNFFKKESLEKYWLLGLIASDGNVNKNGLYWNLSQSGPHGKKVMEYVCELIQFSGKIYTSKTSGADAYSIRISSSEMVKDLFSFGITPKKTFSLRFTPIKNESFFRAFVRGYIDGDGCIGIYSNARKSEFLKISFLGNMKFMDDIRPFFPIEPKHVKKGQELKEFAWNGQEAVAFGAWLFSDSLDFTSRKYDTFVRYINSSSEPAWSRSNKIKLENWDELFKPKITLKEVETLANRIGVNWRSIYSWRKSVPQTIKRVGNFYVAYGAL